MKRSLSVVVPAFNEETRLPATLDRFRSYFQRSGRTAEVIIVDDGSRDRTRNVAEEWARRERGWRVIGLSFNQGKARAVRAGILAAEGDEILFCDADGATPIEDVEKLSCRLERGFDVAVGSRYLPGTGVTQSLRRRLAGRTFSLIAGLLGTRAVTDTQCGFKLFRREAARRLFSAVRSESFAFDVELLVLARRWRYRVVEVPVRWSEGADSRVRMTRDAPAMLWDLLRLRSGL